MRMKKRLFSLLAALLCMVMLMGCTTHAEPESNKLTEAELQELQELFAPGSWYAQACTSYYEAAEAVNLRRLFYDGIGYAGLVYGQCYVTDRERNWVLEQEPAAENYGIFRAPRAAMDDILRQYFDISLDDTRKMGLDSLLYWEEADAWYAAHTDTGLNTVTLTGGERTDDGLLKLLPQAGRQLELCWRTSRDSHPSGERPELRTGVSLWADGIMAGTACQGCLGLSGYRSAPYLAVL